MKPLPAPATRSFSGRAPASCGLISITVFVLPLNAREGRHTVGAGHPSQLESLRGEPTPGRNRLRSRCLKASASCGAEQPTWSLLREREIAAISTLVFDSCRSRYPSDLSKSSQVYLPKTIDISDNYKFRTKTAKYRALEKNARRER